MKLQLKRSNVLELGGAKEPTAAQMEYGELAVNYNNGDPAIFLKDSNDNIIRIAGVGNINSGDTPSGDVLPPTGNQVGDVFFNTTNNTMYYWDGSQWVPIANDVTAADIFVGTLAEIDAEVPANERRNGFLWWNTEDGTLYIWYIDANTSQFVIAIPSTGGGGGGASVAVNNVPPTNANQGDMWWNTTDGRLYIWYQDVDTGQWVDASPDSQVSPITSGENFPTTGLENDMFFNTTDGRLYIYYNDGSSLQWVDASPDSQGAIYWDRNGTTLSPSTAGDDVDLGNIQLLASGAAKFSATTSITRTNAPDFCLKVKQDTTTGGLWVADGTLYVGGNLDTAPLAPNITLNASGTSRFEEAIQIGGTTSEPNITLSASTGQIITTAPLTINKDTGYQSLFSYDISQNSLTWSNPNQKKVSIYSNSGNTTGVVLGISATSWSSLSQRSLKTDLVPISDGLNKVATLAALTGTYKADKTGAVHPFLIADEVKKVLPEAVDGDGSENDPLSLRYTEVIPLLVSALHDAKDRIETLEAEVQALKGGN